MANSLDSDSIKHHSSHDSAPVSKVIVSGEQQEYVTLGNKKYLKSELRTAFGGTFNPDRYSTYPVHKFANPVPLALFSFGMSAVLLGLYNANAMGIFVPNAVITTALFYGGVCQCLAGIWGFLSGDTFVATVFLSFGPFWMSFGSIYLDSFGILTAYADEPAQLNQALALFLLGWALFTFMLVLCALKSTFALLALLVFLDLTFILLTAGYMSGNANVVKAGFIVCVITGFIGWYNAFAGVADKFNSYFQPIVIPLPTLGKE